MPFVLDGDRLSQLIQVLKDERREVSAIEQLCPSAALDPLDNYRFLRQYVRDQTERIQRRIDFLESMCETASNTASVASHIEDAIYTLNILDKM